MLPNIQWYVWVYHVTYNELSDMLNGNAALHLDSFTVFKLIIIVTVNARLIKTFSWCAWKQVVPSLTVTCSTTCSCLKCFPCPIVAFMHSMQPLLPQFVQTDHCILLFLVLTIPEIFGCPLGWQCINCWSSCLVFWSLNTIFPSYCGESTKQKPHHL